MALHKSILGVRFSILVNTLIVVHSCTMNDIANRLFGKEPRTDILRAFALASERPLSFDDVLSATRLKKKLLTKELSALKRAKVIAETRGKNGKGMVVSDTHIQTILKQLFTHSANIADEQLVQKVKKAGPLKMLVCSGVLIGEGSSELDLLIVGAMNEKILSRTLKPLEAHHGTELRCALFTEEEFYHRLDVRDLLIANLLQGRHRVLFDKTKRPQKA